MNAPKARNRSALFAFAGRWLLLCGCVLAAGLAPVGSAQGAEITYVSITGSWRDPVDTLPGSQPGDPAITNGDPTSIIRWGETSGSQSGYDFTASLPPPFELPGPIPFFSLGDFTHRNFTVDEPWLTSVILDVVLELAVDGVPTGPLTFTFTFNHEETPNNPTPPDTCPYPTPPGEGCTDRVTIVASPNPTTFNVGGVDYTLEMSFLDNGSPVDEFITREGGTVNGSGLVGEFTLPPGLRVTKTGPPSLRLAQWGEFLLDVQNDGDSNAHDVTILDRLPDSAVGGMCDRTPEIQSAQVFAPDGVTPVPGKGPLVEGSDYSVVWDGAACELTFVTQSPAAVIDIDERLMIRYRTQLDADSQDGITLTNVAGATAWFSDAASNPARVAYLRTLTDGTPALVDHEDAHAVAVDLPALAFEKTVSNLTSGDDPATVATPGDRLRYRLRVENLGDVAIDDFSLVDELDALNATPAFAAGTLAVITAPAGADLSNSSAAGGAAGTGLVDVRNLSLGGLGDEVVVEFEVDLVSARADGSTVDNQAALVTGDLTIAQSDDPNVNGVADPDVVGDEDPTRVTIESGAYFDVDKISAYLDGDPNQLLAGERLRYTITVQNVGTEDATDARLRDALPVNTAYVAGSTTLNGVAVPDGPEGGFPLSAGIDINAPENTSPGYLRADSSPGAGNVATIQFDVTVAPAVADGTVIANQAFVASTLAGVDQPSDDPRTEAVDDPTRDVVGNYPLLFAVKTAALEVDEGSPGIVDPGDYLRYTIVVYNDGTADATGVRLTDLVPTDTSYRADSVTLNGLPVAQPDDGVFPLEAGLWVSSSDRTPPLPGPDEGVLSAGQAATVQFDVRVNDGVVPGTQIINQATVTTAELGDLLTDGDGNPATGPEPTIVVVGPAQQLAITKQVAVVGGGAAVAGATLEYAVQVRNVGALPALDVRLMDNLDDPLPGQLLLDEASVTLNGAAGAVTIDGSTMTVDYGDMEPGAGFVLRFRAMLEPTLAIGTRVINLARVYWNTDQQAEAIAAIDVGGIVGVGILNGSVWHDADFDDVLDPAERVLAGWNVDLLRNDEVIFTTQTDAEGVYQIVGVTPNYNTDDTLALQFRAPDAGPATALLGEAYAPDFATGLQRIYDIEVFPGNNLQNLDLPIDPNGVVYDSLSRLPVAGVTLTLTHAATGVAVDAECFDDAGQQNQRTRSDGYYKFDLNFSQPSCPAGAEYSIVVGIADSRYNTGDSQIIPPPGGPDPAPLNVPACPGSADDALPDTIDFCELQTSEFAPASAVPAQSPGTRYRLRRLVFDDTTAPGSAQLFNNHLPVDPVFDGVVGITKTTPMVNINRGDLVPYTIEVSNSYPIPLQVTLVDRFPPGFRYVEGSARLDGVALEPVVTNRELRWAPVTLAAESEHRLELLLAAGAGVQEGEYVNRAQALTAAGDLPLSGVATATVRLVPDPTMDCTDVMGKVFDDDNLNGLQDEGEAGLAGVRLVTARGLVASTDAHGRFHITCAAIPREDRGSNFVLKLDDRTLPSGFRSSTAPVQVKRATRGKALYFNFGAAIHRVVGLELADGVFEADAVAVRPQWRDRFDLLVEELDRSPAILRLTYLADLETPRLVDQRLRAVRGLVARRWRERDGAYALNIEQTVHWRRGGPAGVPAGGRRD